MAAATALAALMAGLTQADVFNMPPGQTSMQFVTVGDPGNAADTAVMDDSTTGYGAVPYTYQIGKYDTTLAQYCQFLNAVAKTDTYGLFNPLLATWYPTNWSQNLGITQSGSPAPTATRSWATAMCRHFSSRGATRPASATGCRTASPPGAGRRHNGNGGVHPQWRDHE